MKIVLLIVALVTLVTLETTAIAQPSAEDLYTEGQAAYNRADYVGEITKWQASYDLSKEAGLLFNLAQAQRLVGDCANAIATYRRFDTTDADYTSEQHKLAKDFVRELEGTCPEPKSTVNLPTIVAHPKLDAHLTDHKSGHGRTWKIASLVTGGVGVVTITIGLSLGHHGASIGDEITTACQTGCDWATLKAKEARGKREVAIGKAVAAAGVVAIAGGAIFYYLGVRQEAFAIAPAPSGNGSVVSWSGSW